MQDFDGITSGQLHSECNENNGCGIKFNVDGISTQVVELERDEAVIIPESFDKRCFIDSYCKKPAIYKMTGSIKQIASAINMLGGGKNFSSGAKVWKNGRKMTTPRMISKNKTKSSKNIASGSVVINRTNILNPQVLTFEGTAYEIASKINSYGGNGVELSQSTEFMKAGGEIEKKKQKRSYKVRFHLGRGKNFMHWKIENKDDKSSIFLDPKEVQLILLNCKLTNSKKTAGKIYRGEMNKSPIAWIECSDIKVLDKPKSIIPDNQLRYNPRVAPNWHRTTGEDVDNFYFDKIRTVGSNVYFEGADGTVYKLGGLIDLYLAGGKISESDSEQRYVLEIDTPTYNEPNTENKAVDFFNTKLMKDGGRVDMSAKKLSDLVEKEALRLKTFREKKESAGHKAGDISTMVHQFDDVITLTKQREALLEWGRDESNNVIFIVAFSGGKDSVAMVLHLLYDLYISPDQIELWHHEVDGKGEDLWDWNCTTSYCRSFAKYFNIPILFSYRDGGITDEIFRGKDKLETSKGVYFQTEDGGEYDYIPSLQREDYLNKKMKFPAVGKDLNTRWCSPKAKIDVMSKAINNMKRLTNAKIIICTGERRLESTNRSEYLEIEPYRSMTQTRQAITWRPVIDWTETKIWDYYAKFGIQPHPSYELGWGRCSCQLCIFSSADHWATNNELSPKKVERIAEIENQIGNKLYNEDIKSEQFVEPYQKITKTGKVRNYKGGLKMLPTGEKKGIFEAKVNIGKSFLTPELEARWKDELLGEFISPIKINNEDWKLPFGAFKGDDCGAD